MALFIVKPEAGVLPAPIITAVAPVKLVPVMVIMLPALPDVGVKDVIVGLTAVATLLMYTFAVELTLLMVTISGFPSPFISPTVTSLAAWPAKDTAEPKLIIPPDVVLGNTVTLPVVLLQAITRSSKPSPVTSPMAK